MILLHPQRAAQAMGSQCSSPDGVGDEALLEALRLITPRVEAALECYSLRRGVFVDTFAPSDFAFASGKALRLSTGFVVPDTVALAGMYDSGGTAITEPDSVDLEYGLVHVKPYSHDVRVTVTYEAGFLLPEDESTDDLVHAILEYRTAIDVPEFIEGAVHDLLIHWKRNSTLSPSAPKEYGFLPTINEMVTRDLRSRIYGRYMRPRDHIIWPSVRAPSVSFADAVVVP